jgi:hypothetical protein
LPEWERAEPRFGSATREGVRAPGPNRRRAGVYDEEVLTVVSSLRYAGCAVGFGLGVVWMTVGLGSAILVLLCTALGYGVAFIAEHERADLSKLRRERQTPSPADEPLLRDEFELDRNEVELPEEEVAARDTEIEYGWPSPTQ